MERWSLEWWASWAWTCVKWGFMAVACAGLLLLLFLAMKSKDQEPPKKEYLIKLTKISDNEWAVDNYEILDNGAIKFKKDKKLVLIFPDGRMVEIDEAKKEK